MEKSPEFHQEVTREEMKTRIVLFIDDDAEMISSLQRTFRNNLDVAFAECHSVRGAIDAIAEHKPEIVFLDNSLTDGGNEGLDIADQVEGIKIYSTTANKDVIPEYQRRGIENIGKSDIKRIKSIITAK